MPCGMGGRGSLPPGAAWLWWEQIVFTPSPHTQPTLSSYSQGLSHPWALCAICTFAALAAESCLLQPGTSQEAPRTQVPFLSRLVPITGVDVKPGTGVDLVRGHSPHRGRVLSLPIYLERDTAWKWSRDVWGPGREGTKSPSQST